MYRKYIYALEHKIRKDTNLLNNNKIDYSLRLNGLKHLNSEHFILL